MDRCRLNLTRPWAFVGLAETSKAHSAQSMVQVARSLRLYVIEKAQA